MKALLVANYEPDRQESMLRFASVLAQGLAAAGIDVTVARPTALFGRLRPGSSGLAKWLGYLDKFLLFPPRLRRLARQADIVHLLDQSNGIYLKHLAARPHLVTCHDLLAIRSARGEFSENKTGWSGRLLQRWILSGLRRARRVTCDSAATRADFLRLTGLAPAHVSVTPVGMNYPYAPIADPVAQGAPAPPYLLHVGGDQWYKNRDGLLAIYRALRLRLGPSTPPLILVGPPLKAPEPGVQTRQSVANASLAALYSGAELLIFPSLAEGFGWPPIEAQACGCRVLLTRRPPLTEIGGEAAFYLDDPADAEAGANAIAELLTQPEPQRRRAIAAGLANAARFTTEKMISDYAALYRSLLPPRPL